jgi:hypothetical protein
MLKTLRRIVAVPFIIAGLPAIPGCLAFAGQALSAATSATRPFFSWRTDRILMNAALPFLPSLWIGGWLWFGSKKL